MTKKYLLILSFISVISTTGQLKATPLTQDMLSIPLKSIGKEGDATENLGNYKGMVLLVNFWTSWSAPCLASFPFYQRLQNTYGNDGFMVIGINVDNEVGRARQFYNEVGVSFLNVIDENKALAKLMNPGVIPTSFLIDRQGNIVHTYKCFRPGDEDIIEKNVKELVSNKSL